MSGELQTGVVQSFERIDEDGIKRVDVQVDSGGERLLTLEHVDSCGEDAPPLPGDFVGIGESTGEGAARSAGYADHKNEGKALGGEKRFYSRHPDTGEVIAEGWLHGDGLVEFTSLKTGVAFKFGPVEIDDQGNIATPGEITAKSGTPAMVTLTKHTHPTGTGPSGSAIPGA